MAGRRQSAFEDLIEATARVPWWVGLALAIIAYFVLHLVATSMQVGNPTDLNQFTGSAIKQVGKNLASIFQYVIPAAFLIGSVASVFARRKRAALYAKVSATNGHLAAMSWQDFELLVGEFFRHRGFSVKEVGGGGADGGVDLIISSGKDRYVVQCKQWKAMQVGVATVRELYGVMTAMGAVGGFVVTSGTFTKDAKRFAEGREIELVAAEHLLTEIGKDQATASAAHEPAVKEQTPSCPKCGSAMLIRTARQGPQAGDVFWGCSTFPACRGTRPVTAP